MDKAGRTDEIKTLRVEPIAGEIARLEPYCEAHAEAVIALRNTNRARHFLTQESILSLEDQARWFQGYLERDDDLQWAIYDHRDRLAGVTALYDIDLENGARGEKGRLVVDEALSREAPIVLEAELLLLDAAFSRLGLMQVYTRVRPDNPGMISINKRLGFDETGRGELRGAEMIIQTLNATDYRPENLQRVVRHWRARLERTAS